MNNESDLKKTSVVFQTPFFLVISLVLGIAAAVIRTFQILYYTDFSTGFYSGPLYLTVTLNCILAVALVLLICMAFLDKNNYKYPMTKAKSRIIGIFALLMGMALAFYATTDLLTRITANLLFTPGVIKIILQYLASLSLMHMAMVNPSPNKGLRDLIHLLPCLWACATLASMFLQHTIVINVAENLYNLIRMVFVLLFFFYCAKYYAGYTNKGTGRGLAISGCMVFILGCVCTFPILIAHLNGKVYLGSHIVQSSLLDVTISFYALIYTVSFLSSRKKLS